MADEEPRDERPRQEDHPNLLKGGVPPNPDGWGRVTKAQQRREEENERLAQTAKTDPEDVILQLFTEAAITARDAYRRRNKGVGPKQDAAELINVSREARSLADRCLEIIRTRGSATEAEQFFATVQGRVEALAPRLAESASPLVEAPA